MNSEKKTFGSIKENAEKVKSINRWRKIIPPILGVLISFLFIIYVASLLFGKYGSFTISAVDSADRRYALSLCEKPDFIRKTSKLSAAAAKNITNISIKDLPADLNDLDGSHNGDNYLAYTFYVKNAGELACNFKYSLVISRATLGIEAAARVRVYYNPDYYKARTGEYNYSGDYVDYAKPKTGGNGEPETDIYGKKQTNFVRDDLIAEGETYNFAPNDIGKVTVVIWLEGDDLDCNDDVLGGQLRVDMLMEITGGINE